MLILSKELIIVVELLVADSFLLSLPQYLKLFQVLGIDPADDLITELTTPPCWLT